MTPILYVTDLSFADFDPADLFDLAFLLRIPDYDLRGVCLLDDGENGERVLDALSLAANKPLMPIYCGRDDLIRALRAAPDPVNLVVAGAYPMVADVLQTNQPLFRQKVARLFLVGDHVNRYAGAANGEAGISRLPIDPRLRDRFPERFAPGGDARIRGPHTLRAWASLLTSGEGVIWLPRDVCLFRYAAPGVLEGGGPLCDFLRRELFWANLPHFADRYRAADAPVLLSALPALLLATQPDPFGWMRLFRAALARVETNESGKVSAFSSAANVASPNVYAVVALDGQALGKRLTDALRDRPLTV